MRLILLTALLTMAAQASLAGDLNITPLADGLRCCLVNGIEACGTKLECDPSDVPDTPLCPAGKQFYCHNGHGEPVCECR